VTATEETAAQAQTEQPGPVIVNHRKVLAWEAGAFVWIMLAGSALHFAFELTDFWRPMGVFGSVNESTFEHLKLFFWPGLLFALVQHAYVKGEVNNYWFGKALALVVTPIGVIVSFYFYLGILLPITGRGYLWLDIGTGVFGVLAGNVVAYRILTAPPKARQLKRMAAGILVTLTLAFSLLTWFPPRMFLFENFYGYEYSGEYGILEDYTPYLVFDDG
jgi:hypothetical protein